MPPASVRPLGMFIASGDPMCLAIPGEVLGTYDKDGVRYADVRFGGARREICLHALADVEPGDFVLAHVGFAIAKIDREAAERALELLVELEASSALGEKGENA